MNHSIFHRGAVCALGWFALTIAGAAPGAAPSNAAAGPVIELPKFEVTDSRLLPQPEAWRYAEIPGFEILTNAPDRTTQRLLRDFGIFRQALGMVMPVPTGSDAPTMLILCARESRFEAFVPSGKSDVEAKLASLFLNNHEQSAIVINLGATTLDLTPQDTTNDAATGTNSTEFAVDHDKQLYREYVHYLLSRSDVRPPAWLEEGMAQIIMAMKFDKTSIIFGEVEDAHTVSAAAGQLNALAALDAAAAGGPVSGAPELAGAAVEDKDFPGALEHAALVPWEKFFAVSHESPEALNPLGSNRWAKQAYAFVHMCLYGRGGRYQKPFALFLKRLSKEPPSEALFTECFKMSYKKMLDELRGYIDFVDYKRQEARVKLTDPAPLALRDATQAEIGRIKGETLVLAGHPDTARTELVAAYVRGERDPRLLAALGVYEHATADDEHARKFLEAAVAARVVCPAAYRDLGQLRYADALAKPAGPNGAFSPAQFAGVTDLLRTARQQIPPLPGVYEVLADAWEHGSAKPGREDVLVLVEGVRLFPTRLRLLYQTSKFCMDAGMNDVAWPLVEYGIKLSPDPKGKALFEKLKESLPLSARPTGR